MFKCLFKTNFELCFNTTRNYVERKTFQKKFIKKATNYLETRWNKKKVEKKKEIKNEEISSSSNKPITKFSNQVDKVQAGKRKGKNHLKVIEKKIVPPHIDVVNKSTTKTNFFLIFLVIQKR